MKFHEYRRGPISGDRAWMVLDTEALWVNGSRPYYKAFPCITNALTKIALDIKQSELQLKHRCFAIRFAEGSEPLVEAGGKLLAILTAVAGDVFTWITISVDFDGLRCCQCRTHQLDKDVTLQEEINWFQHNPPDEIAHNNTSAFHLWAISSMTLATRIALTCHLLADDPTIITPDVLGKDRDRYNSEKDEAWKQRAVERARRRGVVGWNIGADYEVCPHYRRPHFALRHTGKGRTVPRIVPVKGSVVHRSRLTEVPTGYILPDGTEVEHGKVVKEA